MWNSIWVTAEAERVTQVLENFRKAGILTKCKSFLDDDRYFFEILVPAAETGVALEILADM
ncbi:MAG: hypothetical protein IJE10_01520 [Clostridia bacterium]|nr:hypothetical protein [Clostridia bacterium]